MDVAGKGEHFLSRYIEECKRNPIVHVQFNTSSHDWNGLGLAFRYYADKISSSGYAEGDIFNLVRDCLVTLYDSEFPSDSHFEETSDILRGILEMVAKKNHDYGSAVFRVSCCVPSLPISSTILVRVSDKFERFWNLTDGKRNFVVESVEDTVKDIVGYLFLFWWFME